LKSKLAGIFFSSTANLFIFSVFFLFYFVFRLNLTLTSLHPYSPVLLSPSLSFSSLSALQVDIPLFSPFFSQEPDLNIRKR